MSIERELHISEERPLDPNVLQRRASDPSASVWVGASAGTGKTKVLTDRVLRLLLPRENGEKGTKPHKILCLTFTKAGAGEMLLRISETLARWAVCEDEKLEESLRALLGRAAKKEEVRAARSLFTGVIDSPSGLKIMTIHSFCQSVLGRFPLEAGINPNVNVLDDVSASELLEEARAQILRRAIREKNSALSESLHNISALITEDQFFGLLKSVVKERRVFQGILRKHFGIDGVHAQICALLNVPQNGDPLALVQDFCEGVCEEAQDLIRAAQALRDSSSEGDRERGQGIEAFLRAAPENRRALYKDYELAFLTQKGELRKTLATKPCQKVCPDIVDILGAEAARILTLNEKIYGMETARATRDLLTLCHAVLEEYEARKALKGGLDYDDLILRTLDLLKGTHTGLASDKSASWVHYKLDQGLDHILIDEAQDTNPEQWQIVEALCAEFFAGVGAGEENRTVFTVGDEKQSIYSFQRASPEEFARMQAEFKAKVKQAEKRWDDVPMNISFRSTKSVLAAVDGVFAPVTHQSFRRGQAGCAELWPVCERDEKQEPDLWNPRPAPEGGAQSGSQKLAAHIARTVKGWIENEEILPSANRPIKAGDVMILVRTRSALVGEISQALKNAGIPVSGLDRMVLNDQIAVQDLLALMHFVLQPRDDLSLACVLKSPLIGMSEEDLYALSTGRGEKSLWEAMLICHPRGAGEACSHPRLRGDRLGDPEKERSKAPHVMYPRPPHKAGVTEVEYLQTLMTLSHGAGPFSFLSTVLQDPCPADPVSGRRAMTLRLGHSVTDPLDELMNLALDFERNHPPALQTFLQAQESNASEIKRELEGGYDEVRIMTVHGAKGLQAPIVILPDTTAGPNAGPSRPEKRLLWPAHSGLDLPLWAPHKRRAPALFQDAMDALEARMAEESRRLLYVAMTRAEDRLYIAGALGKNKMPEESWYSLIERGLSTVEGVERVEGGILRLSNPQSGAPDRAPKVAAQERSPAPLPPWVFVPAREETGDGMAWVNPSHMMEERAASPLRGGDEYRFLRGNLTHKLLQFLPDLPCGQWEAAARAYLARYGGDVGVDILEGIVRETLAVLQDPAFADVFGAGSLAEVPISGYVEGRGWVSGQVDRLCITPECVHIIDFKTNRPPPDNPDDIPPHYRAQMQGYVDVLRQIYPKRAMRASLLWTDGPFLMRVLDL